MNKEQNKKGRSSAIKISRHYQIQETKSMKDSGHEKDIAECGRTKNLGKDGVDDDEKDQAGQRKGSSRIT